MLEFLGSTTTAEKLAPGRPLPAPCHSAPPVVVWNRSALNVEGATAPGEVARSVERVVPVR